MSQLPESGAIRSIQRERRFDHRNECLQWVWVAGEGPLGSAKALLERVGGPTATPEVPQEEPLIAGMPEPGHDLFRLLRERPNDSRTWLLAPPEMEELHLAEVKRVPLGVRRMGRHPPAFVVTADGSHGWVELLGGWWELVEEQARALRQEAVRLFWTEAEAEFAVHGHRRFEQPAEALFDVLGTSEGAPVRIQPTVEKPTVRGPSRIVHAVPPGPDTRLCFAQAGGFDDAILDVVRRSGRVVAASVSLPPLALGERDGTVWLGQDGGWWIQLRLVPEQVKGISALLEALAEHSAAELRIDVPLGELAGCHVWLQDRPGGEEVVEILEIDAGSVRASRLAEMLVAEPRDWPEDDRPHLEHVSRWEVRPPVAPSNANEDPLVGAWAQLDRRFAERVKALREKIESIAARRSLGERFTDFAKAWLGFGRSLKRLQERFDDVREEVPSRRGPEGAPELLRMLDELEREAEALCGRVEDAERKARLAEARRKQETEHAKAVENARKDRERLTREMADLEERLKQAAVELGELEQRPEPKGKKERKRHRRELEAARNRHRDIDKKLEQLRRECKDAEERADAPFVFQPPAELRRAPAAGSFVPKARQAAEQVPSEALPEVGRLLRAGERRFLAIGRWEELDTGQREADRLGADLVATEEI